jgi:hypothetical protein
LGSVLEIIIQKRVKLPAGPHPLFEALADLRQKKIFVVFCEEFGENSHGHASGVEGFSDHPSPPRY